MPYAVEDFWAIHLVYSLLLTLLYAMQLLWMRGILRVLRCRQASGGGGGGGGKGGGGGPPGVAAGAWCGVTRLAGARLRAYPRLTSAAGVRRAPAGAPCSTAATRRRT